MLEMANGLCDNLLTCILRAWNSSKMVVVAPAMNTAMYEHPLTNLHLDFLKGLGYFIVIDPIVKKLACGDLGIGAMAETKTIANTVKSVLAKYT
jgi:phosphopantothenoylcysteine decarboxylase